MSAVPPVLIVGQGLAGSLLADRLRLRGRDVVVIDRESGPRSSLIAGGLFNPVTGRKGNLTWLAEALFSFLADYYPSAEARLGASFYHPMPIYKPFADIEQQNHLLSKTGDPAWVPFLNEQMANPDPKHVLAPHGGMEICRGGWLDVPEFLRAVRHDLAHAYQTAAFEWSQITQEGDGYRWQGKHVSAVVLCQGLAATEGGPFAKLPFAPNHGQLLRVRCANYRAQVLLNRGVFVRPTETQGEYLVGATYERELRDGPSPSGIEEVKQRLNAVLDDEFDVLDTPWGWRPATYDRRPLIGVHPDHPNLFVFNGLGSKGVSLGPYWAERLANVILDGDSLGPQVNILRRGSLS